MEPQTEPKSTVPKPATEPWVDPRITEGLKKIDNISMQAAELENEVNNFKGVSKDKQYIKIEESVTKLLIQLDAIESLGNENLRNKRKACIKQLQQTSDMLELIGMPGE